MLRAPFRIARGVRESVDVVVVEIDQDGVTGRGEGTPTARYGETPEGVFDQVGTAVDAVARGADRQALRMLMPPGAARNAIDCALWDLEARLAGAPYAPPVTGLVSARTISIDTPEAMGAAARAVADARLIKVKLAGDDPAARLRAVRANAPAATLVIDANEGWSIDLLAAMQDVLVECDVKLVEQPLPAAEDSALAGFVSRIPICADESCHVAADVAGLRDRYGFVNIKLDKTGGLTEALDLLATARGAGMGVMVGCMIGTSLAMAPALRVAAHADFADLDGPWWLREDRVGGLSFAEDGSIGAPSDDLWACRQGA
ncbi:N-acetyl-D-Glu racemase DgcA [Sphingomonas sp.]|uniref:N-acetyl-D-Glu racemase DgcA n=1 Tax=Sphingomonas sp. TaxID=28214 RepID=UPI002DD61E7A|nr:N-acetyl-D-Glu racemase DgcA [Sphingomonas sp.]